MKNLNKNSIVSFFFLSFVFGLTLPSALYAATAPSLGSESTFGVVSETFTNSNTAPQTIVNGSVCGTTINVPLPLVITGGAPETPCAPLKGTDQTAALAVINGQACTSIGAAVDLNTITIPGNPPGTFPPGCYSSTGTMNIVTGTTVTLDATAPGGDGGNVWIFRPGNQLTTAANSLVVLANGANAHNVFWAPVGATTLGANAALSLTPTFVGNIFRGTAAGLSITLGHFANLLGRTLAFGSTVTTDANTITVPTVTTLHVIKLVVGGTAVASDFNVHVKNGGVDVSGSPAIGLGGLGTSYSSLSAGTYVVSEDSLPAGYSTTFTGDCDSSGSITLIAGDDKICTIVNTNIPAPAPSSGGGGGGGRRIVVPLIGILKVPTPFSLSAGPGLVTYDFTVWNVAGGQPLHNVTVTDDKCTTVVLLSGDTNNDGRLDIGENWKYRCTMTLSSTTSNTAVATGYNDNNQIAVATAIATVVVTPGLPDTGTLPPLINIIKVPNRLIPFPFGGGNVTYSYTVTNPGVVPMNNVVVTDDKCAPVSRIYGDINNNNLLEQSESWSYTCRTNVPVSTRNVATAIGRANGLTALSYAFATVLVGAPGLPNTGYSPLEKNNLLNIIMLASALLMSISLAVALRKRAI